MIELKKISAQELTELHIPFEEGVLYFYLLKKGHPVGTYFLKDRGNQTVEVSMSLLPSYHYHQVLNREALEFLSTFPKTLGFKKLLTWTTWDSWRKLLKRFFKEVPAPAWDTDLGQDPAKTWLQKEYTEQERQAQPDKLHKD